MGQKKRTLMGFCPEVEVVPGEKWVANLFGQHGVGTEEVQTEVTFLRKAMESMKEKARERGLTLALTYQIGCNLAGGDLAEVSMMIREVFFDYPVIIYRLPDKKMRAFNNMRK
jgi:hypothetical protein